MYHRMAVFLFAGLLLLADRPAASQQPQIRHAPELTGADLRWQFGFDIFQLMLEQQGLVTTDDTVGTLQNDPSKSVIVIIGELDGLPDWMWPQVSTFLRRGGAVLIATDRYVDAKGLCVFSRGPVKANFLNAVYQGHLDCPVIRNVAKNSRLFRGVRELVANRAGWVDRIARQQGDWEMQAWLPRSFSLSPTSSRGSGKPLVATLDVSGGSPGRLLAIGDHSLFINGMLWHGDNAMFALNTTAWLARGGRNRVLFLINGVPAQPGIHPDFNQADRPQINPEDLPDLPKESWLAFANTFVSGLEDADFFNELAIHYPREVESGFYWRCVLLTLACLAGWILCRRLPGGGQPVEPTMRRPAATLLTTRVQDQIRSGNLRPAACELARELCRELTGSMDPRHWSISPTDIQVDGSFMLTRNTRAAFRRLILLAANSKRTAITEKDLRVVSRDLEQIRQLHRESRLSHPQFLSARLDGELSSSGSSVRSSRVNLPGL